MAEIERFATMTTLMAPYPPVPDARGEWVRYSDHQAALAAKDEEIAELKAIREGLVGWADHQAAVKSRDEEIERLKESEDQAVSGWQAAEREIERLKANAKLVADESYRMMGVYEAARAEAIQAQQAFPAELEAMAEELKRSALLAFGRERREAPGLEKAASRLREKAAELRGASDV